VTDEWKGDLVEHPLAVPEVLFDVHIPVADGLFAEAKAFSGGFVILECGRDGDFEIEETANIPQEISLSLTNRETVIDVGEYFPGNDFKVCFWPGVHAKFGQHY